MMRLKKFFYRHGLRPKPGSIFYSPSLSFLYAIRDGARIIREGNRDR